MKTHKFFNAATRQAMFEKVLGYVDKSLDVEAELGRIRQEHRVQRIYRFDLGENAEGYSPRILQYLDALRGNGDIQARLGQWLNAYPDRSHAALKQALGRRYGIPPDWVMIGAGLDAILDMITRVFLDNGDAYLMPVPSFYLFENYAERMGAVPYFLPLREEDEFRWTAQTTQRFKELVDKFRPKLIWLATPNNPTGQFIHASVLEDLIDYASGYNAFVVVDEAYGEYTDPTGGVHSAAQFLERYRNLMVLRTFSKKYGLASLRIGYLMTSSTEIMEGLQIHRHHFPVTQFSADLALIALEDEDFLVESRNRLKGTRADVFERLGRLRNLALIPSKANIFMLRHRHLDGAAFSRALQRRGIVASPLAISGVRDRGFLRFTLRSPADNAWLCDACEAIDRDGE